MYREMLHNSLSKQTVEAREYKILKSMEWALEDGESDVYIHMKNYAKRRPLNYFWKV